MFYGAIANNNNNNKICMALWCHDDTEVLTVWYCQVNATANVS